MFRSDRRRIEGMNIANGTVLHDSMGGANAVPRGAGSATDVTYGVGRGLRLPGGSSTTAASLNLPNGLISSKSRVTSDCWFKQLLRKPWPVHDWLAAGALESKSSLH